jgi:hypothetical protein
LAQGQTNQIILACNIPAGLPVPFGQAFFSTSHIPAQRQTAYLLMQGINANPPKIINKILFSSIKKLKKHENPIFTLRWIVRNLFPGKLQSIR